MSGIFGWSSQTNLKQDNESILSAFCSSFTPSDAVPTHPVLGSHYGLVSNTREPVHIQFENQNFYIIILGKPIWLNSALKAQSKKTSIERVFIENYYDKGPQILNDLHGPFAIALINSDKKETLLAVDRVGIFNLVYTVSGDCLIFGTSADFINTHPLANPELNIQAIYNYLYFHVIPAPECIYRNYVRLEPGSYILFKNGAFTENRYWKIRFDPQYSYNFDALKKEFLELLETSVASANKNAHRSGTFLSGGTDSSTVTGMLGKVTQQPARSFSIGFNAKGFDEMEFARTSANHFSAKHYEYYVTSDDVVEAIPKIAKAYDQPYGNSSAVPVYYCALLAKNNNIDRLLAGDGGDELFGGNAMYAKQRIFSYYDTLPLAFRNKILEPLFLNLASNIKLFPINKIRSYIEQASIPMPARMETYNLLKRLDIAKIFTTDFLQKIDQEFPLNLIEEEYFSAQSNNFVNRMLATDLKFILADNDLPKVTKMCELAGVDVSFPLLDDRIIEFSTKLPPDLKLKGTKLRYFFKEALKDFLPPETLTKKKQGFGLPFGLWLLTHKPLQDLVFDSLESLKSRNIVDPEFIDELKSTHLQSHASYYGTLIWVLVMLEQWFTQHSTMSGFKL
jgi:asparagine synthase (glutamine-hydrolysing)